MRADVFTLSEALADADVLDTCRAFHAHTCLNVSERVLSNYAVPGYFDALEQYTLLECNEARLRFDAADLLSIDSTYAPAHLTRAGSAARFEPQPIEPRPFHDLVNAAFLARDARGRRHTPSAGGLYPIETLIVPMYRGVHGLAAAAYHVLPKTRALEKLARPDEAALRDMFFSHRHDIGAPSLAVVYAMHLARCVIKYRHRGYRHAQIEVGCLLQQVDLVAQSLGLATLPWSAFSDFELARRLELNPRVLLPLCVQFVGVPDARRLD